MKIKKYPSLLFLFSLSLIASLVLSLTPISQICDPGVGCDVVHHSSYNFTFGIQNSNLGVAIFLILGLLTLSHMKKQRTYKKNLIHLGVILGSAAAIYFLYIQHFVLNAYCKYCLVVDFSLLVALGIIIFKWKE